MLFSVLHPSRGRPAEALVVLKHTYGTAKFADMEYLMASDFDDPRVSEYRAFSVRRNFAVLELGVPDIACVYKYNYLANKSCGDVIVTVADDFYLPIGWDDKILKLLEAKYGKEWREREWVIWVDDGDNRTFDRNRYPNGYMTHPILSRKYYQRKGFLFYPELKHYYCDVDFYEQARKDGVDIINAKAEIKCVHRHYQNPGGLPRDNTYARVEAWMNQDAAIFHSRWDQGGNNEPSSTSNIKRITVVV